MTFDTINIRKQFKLVILLYKQQKNITKNRKKSYTNFKGLEVGKVPHAPIWLKEMQDTPPCQNP